MLAIGRAASGEPVGFSEKERSHHVHIIGASGSGKSKLLEHFIRQDIKHGRGLCLIDPHGTLADKIVAWCALGQYGRLRRVHIIRPGDESRVPGFNPLRLVPGEAVSVRVDAMLAACAQAWGVRDLYETPRLMKILRALFYLLAVRKLTLAEGLLLLRAGDPDGLRRTLTEGLPDPAFAGLWQEINSLPRKEFAEHVESAASRLAPFLSTEAMRLVVGQQSRSIDFRAAMDQSEIVIVNLGARNAFSYENARLLGTLLINDLFLTALGRSEAVAKRHPFSLYIDEAYDFLTGDIERILDQTRKFGLHAVLVHHRLGQLRDRGVGIYNAVMSISNKIVFGGLSDEDAGLLAKEVLRRDIDLAERRHTITMPVVVGETKGWLSSESRSESTTTSRAYVESGGTNHGTGLSESIAETFQAQEGEEPEQRGLATTAGSSSTESVSSGWSASEGYAESRGYTEGRAETLMPIREERETSVQFKSLEEHFHSAQLRLRELPDRYALVKRRGAAAVEVRVTEVRALLDLPKAVARYRERVADRSTFVCTVPEARAEIANRAKLLLAPPVPLAEDAFWQEDEPEVSRG